MVIKTETEYQGRKVVVAKLDRTCLAVAVEGSGHDWAAYIMGVPGVKHETEWLDVMNNGNKLSEEIAVAIFGKDEFQNRMYRR